MPINPPASNTQTANGSNLYLLASEGNIPDPLIINDLVVTNQATITDLTVSTGTITLSDTAGNQTLQAIGTDLFYDGQLLAKANDIQNISDWALYPATADVNINGKNLENVLKLTDSNNVFGTNGQYLTSDGSKIEWTTPVSGGVTQLNSLTGNVTVSSTNNATLSIAQVGQDIQLTVPATAVGVSSLNSQTGVVSLTSSGSSVTISNPTPGIINLETATVGAPSWANYPAVNTVNLPDKDFNMTTSTPGVAYNKATLNANVDIGAITNAPLRPDLNAYCGTVTLGGLTTPLTAMNINTVGALTVNSLLGVSVAGGGAVTVSSIGGVVVDGGGAISINGSGGVSIVGSGLLSIASGGILVSGGGIAINGGGVAINAGGLNIVSGVTAIGSAGLAGGGVNVYGSDLSLIPVGPTTSTLRTEFITSNSGTPTLAISNVATINGVAYPPSSSAFSYNIYVSNISGNDTTGNGTISNSYKTIAKAMLIANSISDINPVIINLACGTYTENVIMNRDNIYIVGGSTSLSTATVINGSITIDMTGSSQSTIVGGLSSLQISNIIYNNSQPKSQSFILTDCLIVPVSGAGLVATDISVGGNGDMTIQNCLFYQNTVSCITTSNVSLNFINTQVTVYPGLTSLASMIVTSGTGRVSLFGSSIIQTTSSVAVNPLLDITNTLSTSGLFSLNNAILTYPNSAVNTSPNKQSIRFSNSASVSMSLVNSQLLCEGSSVTNSGTQYVCVSKTGAGAVTLSYAQNFAGATANHYATAITKTQYIAIT